MAVRAGQDHLLQYAKQGAVAALTELIWNGLDAEADLVEVNIETTSIGGTDRRLIHITGITVTDNGHGITPEKAKTSFSSLGDSWKRELNGRTLNQKRPLHGRQGRGRFYAYSLGRHARWSSVSQVNGDYVHLDIDGDLARIDGFTVGPPLPAEGPPWTTVTITVEQGRSLATLLRDDLAVLVAAQLAAHLLGNRDVTVRINGDLVDPQPLMDGQPTRLSLDAVKPEDLGQHETPTLTIVDWTEEMKRPPGIVLCTEGGVSLIEVENTLPAGNVKSTGYLQWSGFTAAGEDLLLARVRHAAIIDEAAQALERHVRERLGALTISIVARLKDEGIYPYPDHSLDPIKETEREMFDLVAVTARTTLTAGTKQQRAMSTRLLQVALQERPGELDAILADTLNLSTDDQAQLADMLKHSSLGSIVGAAAEVARRLDLTATLRHLIYSPDVSARMREVDQLHPLVKNNAWLFGEAWRLSRSEASLTNILRTVVNDETLIEADLIESGGQVLLPDGRQGRVDLLLERSLISPADQQRLVVELKRPSIKLGDKELGQIRGYARALTRHRGIGPSRWTFWLVGANYHDEIEDQLKPRDRAWGHVDSTEAYDLYVTTWGHLLDDADRRLAFYREQLDYDITQDEAVTRVRSRHNQLLPPSHGPAEPAA